MVMYSLFKKIFICDYRYVASVQVFNYHILYLSVHTFVILTGKEDKRQDDRTQEHG